MKDRHVLDALQRALARLGDGAHRRFDLDGDARRWHRQGWVSIKDIEASQAPNTYPRLTYRQIRERCERWSREGGPPHVRTVRGVAGLRTWVRLESPADVAIAPAADTATPREGPDAAPADGA